MFYKFVLLYLCWCHLTGVFSESVSVTEGESVTLHTGFAGIHKDDDTLWKYGTEKAVIAQIRRQEKIFPDGRFQDGLELDKETGSLTIWNITTEQAGDYKLEISGAKLTTKLFSVLVYARLPVPVIRNPSQCFSSEQYCPVQCSVVNVSAVSLSWYKGNRLLSSISVPNLISNLSLPLNVEYQDNNNYSCVINNTISNYTTHLDTKHLFTVDQGPLMLFIILISISGFLLIVATIVMCCICRKVNEVKTGEEERIQKMKKPDLYENVPKRR